MVRKFFIEGPAGKIETVLAEPATFPSGIAVVAHPHPLHGGTMDNKVVHTVFKSMIEFGHIAVKFNFRGTGNSEGAFDHGIGEVEDAVAVVQSIKNQFIDHAGDLPLLLAGFSFGGGVQIQAAERLNPESLILVSPSLKHVGALNIPANVKNTLIIQGDKDDIVPLNTILDWAAPQSLPVVIIPGAEHFFHGKLNILKRVILDYS
ncbi:MAG: alpha/beta hydrolase [Nitrosomonas sp.]|nr:alpha/beta hydrolase [Nitrosomonas sp.]